jgi:hypothetical protein
LTPFTPSRAGNPGEENTMYDRSDQIDQLATALAAAQGEFPPAAESGRNPHLKNRYSTLGDIISACRPAMSKHGLSFFQSPSFEDGAVTVATVLLHSSGQFIETRLTAGLADNRGITQIQGIGSVITYIKRYALAALMGVYTGEDTDGEPVAPVQQQQRTAPTPAPVQQEEEPADWPPAFLDHIAAEFGLRGKPHARNALKKAGLTPARNKAEAKAQVETLRAFRAEQEAEAEKAEVVEAEPLTAEEKAALDKMAAIEDKLF